MVGAGFISFTILNSILALGAKLTIVEIAPRILPAHDRRHRRRAGRERWLPTTA